MKLGVNIDHIATLRQARYRGLRGQVAVRAEPDLMRAVRAVLRAGGHGITLHLREDRRHVQDDDVRRIRRWGKLPLNLEMAMNPGVLKVALEVCPAEVCLVPEKREEITTEGGLNVAESISKVRRYVRELKSKKIVISLFIAPDPRQVRAAAISGADYIELHTGSYAEARRLTARKRQIVRLCRAAKLARSLGLGVNAGHGLRISNLGPILSIPGLETLNIGHTVISRATEVGLERAVREMLIRMKNV